MSTMGTLAKYAMAANAIRTVSVTANRTSIASLRAPLLTFVHQRRLAGGGKRMGLLRAPMKLIHCASLCYAKVGERRFG